MNSKCWPISTLGNVVKFISGGTPKKSEEKYWGGSIPWVSSGEMNKARIHDTELHVTEDGASNGTKLAPKETIFIVVRGMSLAKEFRISLAMRDMTFNQDVKAIYPTEKVVPAYLFYYLKSQANAIKDSASEAAHGTKKLDMQVLEQWPLPLPSTEIQHKISRVLTAYDDLIENNKLRIALLESLAEETYKEWFVRLRFPGSKKVKFKKGIPTGWETRKFREIVSYYIGGGWGEESQSTTFSDSAYVIRGTDIPRLAAGDYSNNVLRYHKSSNLDSRKLQLNDFIFEVSGGSKDQLLGRNLMITSGLLNLLDITAMCASFCKQIRFDQQVISPFFMKYFLKLYYECDLVGIYQVQSTGISNYQFESFLNFQTITIPDRTIQSEFENLVKPIVEQQEKLALENLNLEKTKNMLLPRLISGKLSVEDLDVKFSPNLQELKQ